MLCQRRGLSTGRNSNIEQNGAHLHYTMACLVGPYSRVRLKGHESIPMLWRLRHLQLRLLAWSLHGSKRWDCTFVHFQSIRLYILFDVLPSVTLYRMEFIDMCSWPLLHVYYLVAYFSCPCSFRALSTYNRVYSAISIRARFLWVSSHLYR